MTAPGREDDPLYIFGFIPVPDDTVANLERDFKGHAQHIAPILDTTEGADVYVKLTNLGPVPAAGPDRLAHDPLARLPHAVRAVRRRPRGLRRGADQPAVHLLLPAAQRGHVHVPLPLRGRRARPDGHDLDRLRAPGGRHPIRTGPKTATPRRRSTATSRSCSTSSGPTSTTATGTSRRASRPTMTRSGSRSTAAATRRPCSPTTTRRLPADLRILTQNANYGDEIDYSQPNSALIQVNPGERVLLRLANLGYQQHAMELPGIPMRVDRAGRDVAARRTASTRRTATNTLYIGPGEARDVLFNAPAYDAGATVGLGRRGARTTATSSATETRAGCRTTAPRAPGGMKTGSGCYPGARSRRRRVGARPMSERRSHATTDGG